MSRIAVAVALFCVTLSPRFSQAQIVADSVAEHSGVQGQDGWFYGYYDGDSNIPFSQNDFEEFPLLIGNTTWSRSQVTLQHKLLYVYPRNRRASNGTVGGSIMRSTGLLGDTFQKSQEPSFLGYACRFGYWRLQFKRN